eukprot:scaffold10417_cov137-Skeletonema_marinoi.AAC.1
MADYNGSLEAVHCHIHSVRYDMVRESRAGSCRCRMIHNPHDVAYDILSMPLQRKRMLEP